MKISQKIKSLSALQLTQLTIGTILIVTIALGVYTGYQLIFLVPALLGFGLIKAGLTGNCPLENLIAKKVGNK